MITFNISASSYALWKQSQLLFFLQYIEKSKPDIKINLPYGPAGTLVHESLSNYCNNRRLDPAKFVEDEWSVRRLDVISGLNGKPLKMSDYTFFSMRGKKIIDNDYQVLYPELKIEIPFLHDGVVSINLKGYIDLIGRARSNGKINLIDWKTSSSEEDFSVHANMYLLLYYLKFKEWPDGIMYHYLKVNGQKYYRCDSRKVMEFARELKEFVIDIKKRGMDISKYDIGEYDTPWNEYIIRCKQEKQRRDRKQFIEVEIDKNKIHFINPFDDENLGKALRKEFSYWPKGFQYSKKFKGKKWDGKVYLFDGEWMPFGLMDKFSDFLKSYNEKNGTQYSLLVNDRRDPSVTKLWYGTNFAQSKLQVRYYQKEAVDAALKHDRGIVFCGTGAGKSLIASNLIRMCNTRTLFIVNKIDLVRQTADFFDDDLGIPIGRMVEGNLDIDNQVTVASPQTILAIMKKKDDESKRLISYLASVNLVIWDECHGFKEASAYSKISRYCINCKRMIGLTGTPWREDGATLAMNAMLGDVIYRKTTEELSEEGFILSTECYFIPCITPDYDEIGDEVIYQDAYNEAILENKERNAKVLEIVDKMKDKSIAILTKLVEHGINLHESIPGSFLINGSIPTEERKEIFRKFKESNIVLIATDKILSTGIDIPELDVIINCAANRSDIQTIQTIGRCMRKSEGKVVGYYFDFMDSGTFFSEASSDRMGALKAFGHKVYPIISLDEVRI